MAAYESIDMRGRSLIARLRVVIPMLFLPEGVQFREQYGSLPRTALRLTFRLTNGFLPRSPRDSMASRAILAPALRQSVRLAVPERIRRMGAAAAGPAAGLQAGIAPLDCFSGVRRRPT
jgi:hypothetical protein